MFVSWILSSIEFVVSIALIIVGSVSSLCLVDIMNGRTLGLE